VKPKVVMEYQWSSRRDDEYMVCIFARDTSGDYNSNSERSDNENSDYEYLVVIVKIVIIIIIK